MEYDSGFCDIESDKQIAHELNGLIELAEECVNKIDTLTMALEKVRVYFMVLLVVSTLMAVACAGFALDVMKSNMTIFDAGPGKLIFLAFCSAMTIGIVWVLAAGVSRRRTLVRELYAEKDVHDRLITLIHEQMQRVAHRSAVSPVSFAMLQIRVRRLMR